MPLAEKESEKRGIRDVALVLIAAVLIMSPSYLSSIILHRLKLDISVVVLMALAMFLVGVFLVVKVVRGSAKPA
jgi:hypothetical protein